MDTRLPDEFSENWRGNRNDNQSSVTIHNLGRTSIILLATFAGISIGISIYAVLETIAIERRAVQREAQTSQLFEARLQNAIDADRKAEREARVMQERWNDLKVELARRGIPVSDH